MESKIDGPVIVYDYPLEVSPLARKKKDNPELVERFEVIVAGREIVNAFSELNDPVDQARRFSNRSGLPRQETKRLRGLITTM